MIVVKYASKKLFMTLDFREFFEVLFDRFGAGLEVLIRPMSEEEAELAGSEVGGIRLVHDRFIVIDENSRRDKEIEEEIDSRGHK